MSEPKSIHIYTDGACKKNGSASATGGIGVYWGEGDVRNISARVLAAPVTNNGCELLAIDVALAAIVAAECTTVSPTATYVLYSDSKYAISCVTTWYPGFLARGWMSTARQPVKNKELICSIVAHCRTLGSRLVFEHVKAHTGVPGNEGADKLAVAGCSLGIPVK